MKQLVNEKINLTRKINGQALTSRKRTALLCVVCTERLSGREAGLEEGEPVPELLQPLCRRLQQAVQQQVDAVAPAAVPQELVIQAAVGGVAGEVPDGDVAHPAHRGLTEGNETCG